MMWATDAAASVLRAMLAAPGSMLQLLPLRLSKSDEVANVEMSGVKGNKYERAFSAP